jgi:hypothetical protein
VFDEMLNAMRRDKLVFHLCFEPPTLKLNILVTAVSQLVNPDIAVVVSAPGPGSSCLASHDGPQRGLMPQSDLS